MPRSVVVECRGNTWYYKKDGMAKPRRLSLWIPSLMFAPWTQVEAALVGRGFEVRFV